MHLMWNKLAFGNNGFWTSSPSIRRCKNKMRIMKYLYINFGLLFESIGENLLSILNRRIYLKWIEVHCHTWLSPAPLERLNLYMKYMLQYMTHLTFYIKFPKVFNFNEGYHWWTSHEECCEYTFSDLEWKKQKNDGLKCKHKYTKVIILNVTIPILPSLTLSGLFHV